jgi:hypothetical protein
MNRKTSGIINRAPEVMIMIRFTLPMLLLTAGIATAQVPFSPTQPNQSGLPSRPVYSPYLNLLNGNAPVYQKYYGLVLPQIQQQNQINNLQQQVTGLQNTQPQAYYAGSGGELFTGKQVSYFTHRGYFMNAGGVQNFNGIGGQYSTAGNNVSNPYYSGSAFGGGSGYSRTNAGGTGPYGLTNPGGAAIPPGPGFAPNTSPLRR